MGSEPEKPAMSCNPSCCNQAEIMSSAMFQMKTTISAFAVWCSPRISCRSYSSFISPSTMPSNGPGGMNAMASFMHLAPMVTTRVACLCAGGTKVVGLKSKTATINASRSASSAAFRPSAVFIDR